MIPVIDMSDHAAGVTAGAEVDALIKAWADRGDVRTSTAIACFVAASTLIAKRAGISQETLINALIASWGGDDD